MEMPQIAKCDASECSYNRDNLCHALAITVGNGDSPMCDTFCRAGMKGGDQSTSGRVGACKVTSCAHNNQLECAANAIMVGMQEDEADCMTFSPKSS